MKCEICNGELPIELNSVVCAGKCSDVRKKYIEIGSKFFPSTGCENCHGDLHQGCSDECKESSRKSHEFYKDIWSLIKIIYPDNLVGLKEEMLTKYSEWLEKNGYLDSDWWSENPTAIHRYLQLKDKTITTKEEVKE